LFEAFDATTARNPAGTTVEIVDEGLRYRSEGRSLFVPLEYLYGENEVVIYGPSIRAWEVPDALDAIGTIERVGIVAELSAALTVLGVKHRVES
jgi:hypothetical protein